MFFWIFIKKDSSSISVVVFFDVDSLGVICWGFWVFYWSFGVYFFYEVFFIEYRYDGLMSVGEFILFFELVKVCVFC